MCLTSSRQTNCPPQYFDQQTMNKADIIWWPDDKKGLIINAVAARDRALPGFVASRAIRLLFPLPIMVLASYWITQFVLFPDDTPIWVLTWVELGPTILTWACAVMSTIIGTMLFIDWRRDCREAATLKRKASELGVDIAKLDGDWVFEALVMPMVRRKGISLPDGSVAHLRED